MKTARKLANKSENVRRALYRNCVLFIIKLTRTVVVVAVAAEGVVVAREGGKESVMSRVEDGWKDGGEGGTGRTKKGQKAETSPPSPTPIWRNHGPHGSRSAIATPALSLAILMTSPPPRLSAAPSEGRHHKLQKKGKTRATMALIRLCFG